MEQEDRLATIAGEVRAMGFMIGVLIRTHPRRDEALHAFDQWLPEWTDQLATHASRSTAPLFHAALQDKIATFRTLLAAPEPEP